MSSRLETIPTCDRQTPHDGKDRAMQNVARVRNTARVTTPHTIYRTCGTVYPGQFLQQQEVYLLTANA